jgi:hypothetical protein
LSGGTLRGKWVPPSHLKPQGHESGRCQQSTNNHMRKQIIVRSIATLFSLIAITSVRAQSGAYFSAVTNLNPVIYLPLTETTSPSTVPAAANLGTLGSADNGAYTKGAFPGVPGALSGGGDTDTAGLFSGVSDAGMFANYDLAYATNTTFTVELWVNSATADPGEACVASCVDAASPRHGWILYADATAAGTFNFRTYGTNGTTVTDGGSGYVMSVPGGHIVANTWYHVVVSFDGTNVLGYINGQPVTNAPSPATLYTTSTAGAFSVGARSDNSFNWNGWIDDAAFYPTVLSASVISNHYADATTSGGYSAAVLADSPQLYFRFDEAALPPVAQNYGSAGALCDGYYQNGTLPGRLGPQIPGLMIAGNSYAVQFPKGSATDNGATVLVQGASGLTVGDSTPITLAMWAQAANGNTTPGFQTIIGRGDQSYRFDIDPTHPHWNAGNISEIAAYPVLNDGNWHFWVGTWDGSNTALYIDGIQVGQATNTLGPNGTTHTFDIGDAPDYTGRNFAGGSICQVAVFPTALSLSQIQSLYFLAAGAPPVITSQPVPSLALTGSNASFSVSAVGYGALTYQWYGPGGPPPANLIPGATDPTLTITGATGASAGAYYVVVTDADGLSATNASPDGQLGGNLLTVINNPYPSSAYATAVLGLNPLAYWPLNETTPAPAWPAIATNIGSLGDAGNAIYSGLITFQSPGALTDGDDSILGDGTETQVVLPYQPALSTVPLTLEGWFSPDSGFNGGGETLMADGDPGNPSSGVWIDAGFHITPNKQGDFELLTYYKNGQASGIDIDVTNITPNQWYYVAVTIAPNPTSNSIATGYVTDFYINGTNAGSGLSDFVPNDFYPFKIGNRSDDPGYGSYNFAGGMDEVAFYPTNLSAATILAHYQAGTNSSPATPYKTLVLASDPLLYYRLDEAEPNYPSADTGPVATNYGATGANDNGVYLAGTAPGGVPGPKVQGFPETGTNNVGVAFNHIYWLPGGPTSAGEFNGGTLGNTGLTGYVDVPLDTFNSLDLTGPVALAAWVQAANPNIAPRFETFVGRGDPSYRMDADATSGDLLHFAYGGYGAGDLDAKTPLGDIDDGNWHFVVGEWDGTNQYLYIDGVLNNSTPNSGPPGGDLYDFTIGEAPDDTGRLFDGNMTEVAIFAHSLSAAQVEALYQAAGAAVFINQQPPASQTVGAGADVTISVTAGGGNPTIGYQWFFDGAPVSGAEYSGANTATLTITSAQVAQAGSYTVEVTNIGSTATSLVSVLSVVQAPIISPALPASIYTLAGNEVTLSVGVISQATTTNSWSFNGAPLSDGGGISGATTTTLEIANVSAASAGTYLFGSTNAFGGASTSGSLVVLPFSEPTFNTNGTDWTANNNGVSAAQGTFITNNVIELTTGGGDENTSFFFNVPMYIRAFKASWLYQDADKGDADGGTFCIQNSAAGPAAIGTQAANGGSGGGYAVITNSVALQWELYPGSPGTPGLRFETNGSSYNANPVAPETSVPYGLLGSVSTDLTNGDTVRFDLLYDGENLSVTLTDTNTSATYSTNYDVGPIWTIVGANEAFIGFTAGTGGATSTQLIGDFSFTPIPVLSASESDGTVTISWPTGMGLGPYALQTASSLSSTWTPVPGPYNVVGSQYQTTVSLGTGNGFYRLVAP